jgi:hypothetical protein
LIYLLVKRDSVHPTTSRDPVAAQVLASQFDDDQLVIISDVSVKTTYFTLLNLTENQLPPLTPEVRPLSNLSLALDKCQSLIQVP